MRTTLPEHDVYITDWHNARDVPLAADHFGFDDYIPHLIRFLEAIGPGAHMVAVCQPCVAAFMSMNIDRHVKAHRELYDHLARGDEAKAAQTKAFYDEYFAVLDLTAEFYLETVQLVFQDHVLPLGQLNYQNRKVEPKAIKRTMLFTVEGENDDICAVGQTLAAHDLCPYGPTASVTTCRPASAITVCSPAAPGRTRFIRW